MWQFFNGTDAVFAALEQRATGACVVFPQEPMPPGAAPTVGRIGIEVSRQTGRTSLFVQRRVQYDGRNSVVERWLTDGQLNFATFGDLRRWLQHDLKICYDGATSPTAAQLTDLRAVDHQGLTGIKPVHVDEDELFREMTTRIRGQDDAMRSLAKQVQRHFARRTPRRPATLMALGPTGVGKTASIEHLAAVLAQHRNRDARYGYLRLDMNEFGEAHRVSQLLGAPQGYVGYGDASQLIQVLRTNPRAIVLFDEIEKAHRDVLRTLMNAIDAGRLSSSTATDGAYTLDCRQAIFIFTSNLQAAGILDDLERKNSFGDRPVTDAVCRNHLRVAGIAPELVGRIGGFLVFRPLDAAARAEIVTLAISRVAEEYGVTIVRIDPTVVTAILHATLDRQFGIRPDEYAIDNLLGPAFARAAQAVNQPFHVVEGYPPKCVPADIDNT